MGITSALSNANSGLSVAQKRAEIVSNNVANALTPGFAKRNAEVSAKVFTGNGAGVQFDGASRAIDKALTSDRRLAEGATGREQPIANAYAAFNSALGEPNDPFSLFAQYQNLESSLRSLSQSPESQPLQAQTLDNAKALTSKLHDLSDQAQTARLTADREIGQQVSFVNQTLKEIEKLNTAISIATAGRHDATGLEDQRKVLIDQISQVIPVREVERANNKLDLITNEGVFLLAGKAQEISFTPANVITPTETLANGGLSRLTIGASDVTPGGGSLSIKEGSLAGHFAVRDEIAPKFQTQLDAMARDVIERFEAIDPTLAPGAPGLFTDAGAIFDPTAETGLAQRISINAAVDPAQGGAIWRLRDGLGAGVEGPAGGADIIISLLDALTELKTPPAGTALSGFLSATSIAADISSSIGQARISSESRLAAVTARTQSLIDAEQTATGVDTDLELQKLLLIEQAFAANARVVQTADEMMRTLIEL